MNITKEHITKIRYMSKSTRILIQAYLIRKILGKEITEDLFDDVVPDGEAVYIIEFNVKNDKYVSYNFQFQDTQHGFITKDDHILYVVKDQKMHLVPELRDLWVSIITSWYNRLIYRHQYVNVSNLFYLSTE